MPRQHLSRYFMRYIIASGLALALVGLWFLTQPRNAEHAAHASSGGEVTMWFLGVMQETGGGVAGVRLTPPNVYNTATFGNSYADGTVVTLTADTDKPGYRFDHWEGDLTGSLTPVNLQVLGGPKYVYPIYVRQYKLTTVVSNPADGTLTPYTDQYFDAGTVVTLTATPNANRRFASWSSNVNGPDVSLSNGSHTNTVTMDADKTVTATFAQGARLSTFSSGPGSAAASPPPPTDGIYSFPTSVTLTATPNAGAAFHHWDLDSVTGTDSAAYSNPYTFAPLGDTNATAVFTQTDGTIFYDFNTAPPAGKPYPMPWQVDTTGGVRNGIIWNNNYLTNTTDLSNVTSDYGIIRFSDQHENNEISFDFLFIGAAPDQEIAVSMRNIDFLDYAFVSFTPGGIRLVDKHPSATVANGFAVEGFYLDEFTPVTHWNATWYETYIRTFGSTLSVWVRPRTASPTLTSWVASTAPTYTQELNPISVAPIKSNTAVRLHLRVKNASGAAYAANSARIDNFRLKTYANDDYPVNFPDAVLNEKVHDALSLAPGTQLYSNHTNATGFTSFTATNPMSPPPANQIQNLAGLEHARGLTSLELSRQGIVDLTPLVHMRSLQTLKVWSNPIEDFTVLPLLRNLRTAVIGDTDAEGAEWGPIAECTGLTELRVSDTPGFDNTALASVGPLTQLTTFYAHRTPITSLSGVGFNTKPLNTVAINETGVTDLADLVSNTNFTGATDRLEVLDCPLGAAAHCTQIPALTAAPRSVTVLHESANCRTLTLTTLGAGTITASTPGPYLDGDTVTLTAHPPAGSVFHHWVLGDEEQIFDSAGITLVIDGDSELTAHFLSSYWTLDVQAISPAQGQVIVSPQRAGYALDEAVEVSAIPEGGFDFAYWEGSEDLYSTVASATVRLANQFPGALATVQQGGKAALSLDAHFQERASYIPGCDLQVDIPILVPASGSVNAVALKLDLPEEWRFQDVLSTANSPNVQPRVGSTEELEFLWFEIAGFAPGSLTVLSVLLRTAPGSGGSQVVNATGSFFSGQGLLDSATYSIFLESISGACPPAPPVASTVVYLTMDGLDPAAGPKSSPVFYMATCPTCHNADRIPNGILDARELQNLALFYQLGGYSCSPQWQPTSGGVESIALHEAWGTHQNCPPSDSDYAPQDWQISLAELERAAELFNADSYVPDPVSIDGWRPVYFPRGESVIVENGIQNLADRETGYAYDSSQEVLTNYGNGYLPRAYYGAPLEPVDRILSGAGQSNPANFMNYVQSMIDTPVDPACYNVLLTDPVFADSVLYDAQDPDSYPEPIPAMFMDYAGLPIRRSSFELTDFAYEMNDMKWRLEEYAETKTRELLGTMAPGPGPIYIPQLALSLGASVGDCGKDTVQYITIADGALASFNNTFQLEYWYNKTDPLPVDASPEVIVAAMHDKIGRFHNVNITVQSEYVRNERLLTIRFENFWSPPVTFLPRESKAAELPGTVAINDGTIQVVSIPNGSLAGHNDQFQLQYNVKNNQGIDIQYTTAPISLGATPAAIRSALRALLPFKDEALTVESEAIGGNLVLTLWFRNSSLTPVVLLPEIAGVEVLNYNARKGNPTLVEGDIPLAIPDEEEMAFRAAIEALAPGADIGNTPIKDVYDEIVRGYREVGRPFFLRIGFEANGTHNYYCPEKFRAVYQRIITMLRADGLDFASVFHAHIYSLWDWEDYYPGDEYVDWMGISLFGKGAMIKNDTLGSSNRKLRQFLQFANEHKKPVMIAESTPEEYGVELSPGEGNTYSQSGIVDPVSCTGTACLTPGEGCEEVPCRSLQCPPQEGRCPDCDKEDIENWGLAAWKYWYDPYFSIIKNNPGIKAISYINVNWHTEGYIAPWHKETRLSENAVVRAAFRGEMVKEVYQHAMDPEGVPLSKGLLWKDTAGNVLMRILPTGRLVLTREGGLFDASDPNAVEPDPSIVVNDPGIAGRTGIWMLKNDAGENVAVLSASGVLYLAGEIEYEQFVHRIEPGSFVYRDDAGQVIALFDSGGNLTLRSFLRGPNPPPLVGNAVYASYPLYDCKWSSDSDLELERDICNCVYNDTDRNMAWWPQPFSETAINAMCRYEDRHGNQKSIILPAIADSVEFAGATVLEVTEYGSVSVPLGEVFSNGESAPAGTDEIVLVSCDGVTKAKMVLTLDAGTSAVLSAHLWLAGDVQIDAMTDLTPLPCAMTVQDTEGTKLMVIDEFGNLRFPGFLFAQGNISEDILNYTFSKGLPVVHSLDPTDDDD